MGFIEDERRRRENLARENTKEAIAKRAEEARLSRAEAELKANELRAKVMAYYKESSVPQLVNELSAVIGGNISSGFEIDPRGLGKLQLSLRWDERELNTNYDGPKLDLLANKYRDRYDLHLSNELRYWYRYFLSKSIHIFFYSTGWIQFIAGQEVSSELHSQQWRGKRGVEEDALEKAFRNPGEYVRSEHRPQSSGGSAGDGPGMGIG